MKFAPALCATTLVCMSATHALAKEEVASSALLPQIVAEALADRGIAEGAAPRLDERMITFNDDSPFFTDQTPSRARAGGTGRTVGQQRFNAAVVATSIIESQLRITQPFDIEFTFDELGCETFGIGSYNRSFSNGVNQIPATSYPTALANQLNQLDTSGEGVADVRIILSSTILAEECRLTYDYTLRGSSSRRLVNSIDFVDLLLHEISHGLGFEVRPTGEEDPFIFERFLFAQDENRVFGELSAEERAASAAKVKNLVFTGPLTQQLSRALLRTKRTISIPELGENASLEVIEAVGARVLRGRGITAPLVNLDFDSCAPAGDLADKIVLMPAGCARRELGFEPDSNLGGIEFAQRQGARAVVVGFENVSFRQTSFSRVRIPVVSVTLDAYFALEGLAASGTTARLGLDRANRAGTDNQGRPYVFTGPNLPGGVGVLHFDPSVGVRGNQVSRTLQEPVVSRSGQEPLRRALGLNLPALIDLGWASKRCGNLTQDVLEQCDDGNLINGDGCEQNCLLTETPPVR